MLAPNAVRVLDKVMGIEPEIRKLGYTYRGIEMHASSGTSKMEYLGTLGACDEPKGITIKRPILHAKLLELCEKEELVTVKFGKRLIEVDEKADHVRAVFDDDTDARGEFIE